VEKKRKAHDSAIHIFLMAGYVMLIKKDCGSSPDQSSIGSFSMLRKSCRT